MILVRIWEAARGFVADGIDEHRRVFDVVSGNRARRERQERTEFQALAVERRESWEAAEDKAIPERTAAQEATGALNEENARWDALSESVGGDLFSDPDKLRAMRRVDHRLGENGSWEEYCGEVVAEVERTQQLDPVERDATYEADKAAFMAKMEASLHRSLERGEITEDKFEEHLAWYAEEYDAEHSQSEASEPVLG